jgi:outer membrane protein
MPTVNLQGSLSRSYDAGGGASVATVSRQDSASILGVLSIPIYNGGQTYSQVRPAKESLGQQRLLLDLAREQIQASVVTSWGALEAARAQVAASEAEVRSAEIALAGVREEARVGQRTTLDVLNAQQDVVNARSRLVQAQRDRVVASYTVLAAVGRLGPTVLALPVREYKPAVHYEIVRDKWFGLRTPGGE